MRPDKKLFRNCADFRKILVYILLSLSVVLVLILGSVARLVQIGAIILLGGLVLQILFEILNRPTVLKCPQRFENFYYTWPDVKEYVK